MHIIYAHTYMCDTHMLEKRYLTHMHMYRDSRRLCHQRESSRERRFLHGRLQLYSHLPGSSRELHLVNQKEETDTRLTSHVSGVPWKRQLELLGLCQNSTSVPGRPPNPNLDGRHISGWWPSQSCAPGFSTEHGAWAGTVAPHGREPSRKQGKEPAEYRR